MSDPVPNVKHIQQINQNTPIIEAAIAWSKILPVVRACRPTPNGKCPPDCYKLNNTREPCDGQHLGKVPLGKGKDWGASQIEKYVRQMFSQPRFNLAGVTGYGVVSLDVDKQHGGLESLKRLIAQYGEVITLQYSTQSGGVRYLFSSNGQKFQNKSQLADFQGIEFLGGIHSIILPPSKGVKGEYSTPEGELIPVPEWLVNLANAKTTKSSQKAATIFGDIPKGQRNATLASLAGSLRSRGLETSVIETTLLEINKTQCQPPLPDSEVRDIAKSISRYTPGDKTEKSYPYTDLGNAERLFAQFGDIFSWVTERQKFILWNNQAWEYDTPDHTQMLKLAKATVRAIPNEPIARDEEAYKKLLRWALASESGKHLREMINLVKAEGNITVSINDMDKDPYLFNCQNATIDLLNGEARPHSKDDLITIVAPVDYDPAAKCPKWLNFLNLIQNNNASIIKYLQVLSGYCLTGDTKTDVIPFCHGVGGNGKSTYWTVIRDKIMGAYAYEIDPDIFLVSNQKFKDSGQREELANLFGKRLVTATEIQEGRQLTINLLKAISGGESIHGDRKYEHGITYKPTFKVILSGNNEPTIKDNTNGAWRRLKKIPFTVTIHNQIDAFEETFNDELSGILNWLLEGCLIWQAEGLKDPDEVVKATDEYRRDQDSIVQFLDDCCERKPEFQVAKKEFKTAYLKWCAEMSIKPLSDKELKQHLIVFGIKDARTDDARLWKGIKLKEMTR